MLNLEIKIIIFPDRDFLSIFSLFFPFEIERNMIKFEEGVNREKKHCCIEKIWFAIKRHSSFESNKKTVVCTNVQQTWVVNVLQ